MRARFKDKHANNSSPVIKLMVGHGQLRSMLRIGNSLLFSKDIGERAALGAYHKSTEK